MTSKQVYGMRHPDSLPQQSDFILKEVFTNQMSPISQYYNQLSGQATSPTEQKQSSS